MYTTLEEFKSEQPEDAGCAQPDFKMWDQCPDNCPYLVDDKCTVSEAKND
jgi:hypothetical protein